MDSVIPQNFKILNNTKNIFMDFTMIIINLISIIINDINSINSIISLPSICSQGLCKVPAECRAQRWLQPQRSENQCKSLPFLSPFLHVTLILL